MIKALSNLRIEGNVFNLTTVPAKNPQLTSHLTTQEKQGEEIEDNFFRKEEINSPYLQTT